MGRLGLGAAAALCAALAGCGAGGAGASGGSAVSLTGNLELVSHSPADSAMQVPLDARIELSFDGVVVPECLADEDTWLRVAGNAQAVPGTFESVDGGRTVRFWPQGGLQPETDYEFQLSPLTCDSAGRILERTVRLGFRSMDSTPPRVVGSSVAPGATAVNRSAAFVATFTEDLDPASVHAGTVRLLDVYGNTYATDHAVSGNAVQVTPAAELAGGRGYVLIVAGGSAGVSDRAGNSLARDWSVTFTAATDAVAPQPVSAWPSGSAPVSPRIWPSVTFDESMDPFSVEPASVMFLDEFGSLVPFRVHASRDQRTLHVEPLTLLVPGRDYTMAFRAGLGAATDVSGNALATPAFVFLSIGTDQQPPALLSSQPTSGARAVSLNAQILLQFDEYLDPARVDTRTVRLHGPEGVVPAVVDLGQPDLVRMTPAQDLATDTTYRVRVLGGPEGLRDLAGNRLPADIEIEFATCSDATLPTGILQPRDGAAGVPLGARVSALFDSPLDPASVDVTTVQVWTLSGSQVFGSVALEQGGRVVSFRPSGGWQAGGAYRATLRGGPGGLREASGNWLRADIESVFRTGFQADTSAPRVEVSLNATSPLRSANLVLPPFGFTVDVTAEDPRDYSEDYGTVAVSLQGPGALPDPVEVFLDAEVDTTGFRWIVPAAHALEPGEYTLVAEVADLSGNVGRSTPMTFEVTGASAALLPFERTQVVWVRTDLDRDGNGQGDFADDMLRLGFATPGDPIGTNDYVADIVLGGILARANELLHRSPDSEPLGPDSVPVRLSARRPLGLAHMQMALGGPDPAGRGGRVFGDPSTGILGRALYDYRNSQVNELNISRSPALGVFPAELYLFQAELHLQVYPSFLTLFGQRFLNICPDMGGVPAGSHAEDPVVLAPGFVYATATSQQRARFHQVFDAADDWAAAIGVVLAHEVGHSIGLVAPGPAPRGLHGDNSLHNDFSTAAEVMASAVGYESMVTLDYRFRDLNLAYLRQRVLLK